MSLFVRFDTLTTGLIIVAANVTVNQVDALSCKIDSTPDSPIIVAPYIVSSPAPPVKVSSPSPPRMVSSPVPPVISSSPSRPVRILFPSPPSIVSLPDPPVSVSLNVHH